MDVVRKLILEKAPLLKIVPMIGSMGCPYTCSFCIDSTVPYQPLSYQGTKEDLQFLLTKFKQPVTAAWYDPSNGMFTPIIGSPFPNSGTMQFMPPGMPPGKNHDGDSDWVLVFEVTPVFP